MSTPNAHLMTAKALIVFSHCVVGPGVGLSYQSIDETIVEVVARLYLSRVSERVNNS